MIKNSLSNRTPSGEPSWLQVLDWRVAQPSEGT